MPAAKCVQWKHSKWQHEETKRNEKVYSDAFLLGRREAREMPIGRNTHKKSVWEDRVARASIPFHIGLLLLHMMWGIAHTTIQIWILLLPGTSFVNTYKALPCCCSEWKICSQQLLYHEGLPGAQSLPSTSKLAFSSGFTSCLELLLALKFHGYILKLVHTFSGKEHGTAIDYCISDCKQMKVMLECSLKSQVLAWGILEGRMVLA